MTRLPVSPDRLRDWTAKTLRTSGTRLASFGDALAAERAKPTAAPPAQELDPLTGFQTRDSFIHHLENALHEAERTGNVCGLIQVDIDQFSALNASYGHAVGDEVLLEVGQRINDSLRPNDVIARLRRDEFVILCRLDTTSGTIVRTTDLGQRIQRSMDQPVITSAGEVRVTIGIGTTSVSSEAIEDSTPQRLLQEAQTASTLASGKGRAQLVAFDAQMHQQAAERYRTEHELRSAIRGGNLGVHYQPFYNLNSGATAGVEALARWNHPTMGAISPGLFIPVAEESGLIDDLGLWVMNSAMKQASEWFNSPTANTTRDTFCTINLSSRQLLDPALTRHVSNALTSYELDPTAICFEITESVVMSDVAASMNILGELKDLGVILAIDDFGTGYSSLSYLRRLPVDILKIDMSFVQSVCNRDDRMITRAIIDLAHTLGMTTVAEGVESMLQVEILDALECDMAQGYLLHYPSAADEVSFDNLDFGEDLGAGHLAATPPDAGRVLPL